MRKLRRAIPPLQRQLAAIKLAQNLNDFGLFNRAANIAFYLPNDGEISTHPTLKLAFRSGMKCYAPKVEGQHRMHFRKIALHASLATNLYGIAEPSKCAALISPHNLQAILLPLVAFDGVGNRIGMGGGYYDRLLASLRNKAQKPLLIGLAYSAQQTSKITEDAWDISLDYIVTEKRIISSTKAGYQV